MKKNILLTVQIITIFLSLPGAYFSIESTCKVEALPLQNELGKGHGHGHVQACGH
jgi:hypothetical protein